MEVAYEALEAAGIPVGRIQGSTAGVFVGMMGEDYSNAVVGQDLDNIPTYFSSGTARSTISNRLSYFFDLHGPSMTIDTACSSSLVALHQAVSSLRSGESSLALVAGANLLLSPEPYVAESKLRMLSPSGRSRMWDKDADGYGRGDGFAVLVLKTLSKALADGDSIECLIRETGVNQDGRTKGITMPSAKAQMSLIRDTYQRAGLDPSNPADRPQYFEAHGTGMSLHNRAQISVLDRANVQYSGTAAGDPQEAEAIAAAFYPQGQEWGADEPPLHVGSIKTIIGHSEGAAGLAGVMKALLAMKHNTIPPNMLLRELSPAVRPFYSRLQIPETALDWGEVPGGHPRRASVNSFGFGGTNAHAILEEFTPPPESPASATAPSHRTTSFLPFLFSAASEKSLLENISAYGSWIQSHSDTVNLRDLSWTLSTRRSTFPVRVSVSASNPTDLIAKLKLARDKADSVHIATAEPSARSTERPSVLGIFTGQGAQWAAMGAELLRDSPAVMECFDRLQQALDTLPRRDDVPSWRLVDELVKEAHSSRLTEDEISQPLCTAVQIALVDLLRAAKICLTAVVGHSSGEIAAAYAAGYISARDAIRIAYYRGLSLRRRREETQGDQIAGAMLAVGTSPMDAQELCDLPSLRGRICVAAKNSPTSVTLSGDADAIQDAKEIMEDEGKFARLLRVNTAYHSHHMLRAAELYLESLSNCDIASPPHRDGDSDRPIWISSVTGDDIELDRTCLENGTYWRDNMVQPVLFSQAVDCAVSIYGPFDGIMEIGPHPALKGPTSDTIQAVYGEAPPYIGTLRRGSNGIEAFADGLGSLWTLFGPGAVDFDAFDRAMNGASPPKLLRELPSYSWNHDRGYWHENRYSRAIRLKGGSGDAFLPHPLIGRIRPGDCDDGTGEFRFRNRLSLRELPWLAHHKIQGQAIFPAAGYVCAVVEAVTKLPLQSGGFHGINAIEFSDIVIGKALVLPEGGEGGHPNGAVETLLSLKVVADEGPVTEHKHHEVSLFFGFYSCQSETATSMTENASGKVRLLMRGGPPGGDVPLPPPSTPDCRSQSRFLDVDPGFFYSTIQKVGYGYEQDFRGISGSRRTMNEATGFLAVPEQKDANLIIHPATLDCAVQAVLLAYCYPGDGRLRSVLVPTRIERITIDIAECLRDLPSARQVPFYSRSDPQSGTSMMSDLVGDVEIHAAHGEQQTLVLLQGLHVTPLTPPSSADDHKVFLDVTWAPGSVAKSMHVSPLEHGENQNRLPCMVQLESIVEQLTHRIPHMNILAIGKYIWLPWPFLHSFSAR